MPVSTARARAKEKIASCLARRSEAGLLLADDPERVARACHAMANRFHRGGKLIVFGSGGPSSDAQHVAVEFIHPVIVGKRALPAISLTNDVATVTGAASRAGVEQTFAHQIRYLGAPDDIAMGISSDGYCRNVLHVLRLAHENNLLTIAMTGGDGGEIAGSAMVDFAFVAHANDPLVVKEIQVTTYHILWELVHVFFEQPGVLEPGFLK